MTDHIAPHSPQSYDRQTACLALIHFTPLLSIHSRFPSLSAHIACLAAYIHISTYTQRPEKDNLLLSIKDTVSTFPSAIGSKNIKYNSTDVSEKSLPIRNIKSIYFLFQIEIISIKKKQNSWCIKGHKPITEMKNTVKNKQNVFKPE